MPSKENAEHKRLAQSSHARPTHRRDAPGMQGHKISAIAMALWFLMVVFATESNKARHRKRCRARQ